MRGVLIRLVVIVLAGCAATVVVAWGCALGPQPPYADSIESRAEPLPGLPNGWWSTMLERRTGAQAFIFLYDPRTTWSSTGPRHPAEVIPTWSSTESGELLRWAGRRGPPYGLMWEERACGWPIPAMRCVVWPLELRSCFQLGESFLPLRPIPIGFAIDTLVMIAIGLALVTIVRAPRFLGRRLLGRCARCGYDLRGSPDSCPECGRRVAPRGA